MGALSEVFTARVPDAGKGEALEARLQQVVREAGCRDAAGFVAFVAERLSGADDPAVALERLVAPDLHLAWLSSRGDPAALRELDARHLVPAARGDGELLQALRSLLLVGSPPKIATYAGLAPLASWLKVITARLRRELYDAAARDGQRAARSSGAHGELPLDPELQLLKQSYGAAFSRAIADAVSALPPRDQNMLRLYYLDDVPLARLAALHGVHESTVSRRLSAARAAVLKETRKLLGERLSLSRSQFESVLGLVRSQLELSLRSAFIDK